jgi:hypothetical protein
VRPLQYFHVCACSVLTSVVGLGTATKTTGAFGGNRPRDLIRGLPQPRSCFFRQSQFEGPLGDNFLEVLRFAPELLDLVSRRRTSGVPRKPALAGLEGECNS